MLPKVKHIWAVILGVLKHQNAILAYQRAKNSFPSKSDAICFLPSLSFLRLSFFFLLFSPLSNWVVVVGWVDQIVMVGHWSGCGDWVGGFQSDCGLW